jgi:hypothetical protein
MDDKGGRGGNTKVWFRCSTRSTKVWFGCSIRSRLLLLWSDQLLQDVLVFCSYSRRLAESDCLLKRTEQKAAIMHTRQNGQTHGHDRRTRDRRAGRGGPSPSDS